MLPILFNVGPFAVHAYGFFVALAFLVGSITAVYFAKREGIGSETVLDLAIYVVISAVVGARLFYVFLYDWEYFRQNPIEIIMVQKGGLVFLGGMSLSIVVVAIYARLRNISMLKLYDAIAPGMLLGQAIGRSGCFLNGCCFGIPTKFPWGVIFPAGSDAAAYFPGQPLHPVQIYTSLAMLLAFLLLVWIYRFKKFDGQIFFWGLILYSAYRFMDEFLRVDPRWMILSIAQWMVIFTFAFGVWGLLRYRKKPGA